MTTPEPLLLLTDDDLLAQRWQALAPAPLHARGIDGLDAWRAAGHRLVLADLGCARAGTPPLWTRHLAALLTLPAFVLVVAAYVPGNHFKARIGHPMYLGVKMWALAHLLSNGRLADVLLFGGLLAWSVAGFVVSRKRDRAAGMVYAPGRLSRTMLATVVGAGAWAAFAMWAHAAWIGVRPFG